MSDIGARKHENNGEDGSASELKIIFNDDDIVVIDKPHGLRTVPGKASGAEAETRAHVRKEKRRTLPLRARCGCWCGLKHVNRMHGNGGSTTKELHTNKPRLWPQLGRSSAAAVATAGVYWYGWRYGDGFFIDRCFVSMIHYIAHWNFVLATAVSSYDIDFMLSR